MGVVVDPFARCRNPLACRDSGGVADDRDQIAMAAGLCPQNAEAVLAIVEGDTLDKARQYFLGRWFLLWPHLCCRCWRQSPQPDLETCAALALLVSDAVPASTFDRRPPSRWQPSSDSVSTNQSFQPADLRVGSKEAVSAGIFAGTIPLFRSL